VHEPLDGVEILTTVFLCVCALGGGAYGWLFVGNVQSVIGGVLLCGTAGILLAAVVGLAAHAVTRLKGRRGKP
jgi:hypothetical protein